MSTARLPPALAVRAPAGCRWAMEIGDPGTMSSNDRAAVLAEEGAEAHLHWCSDEAFYDALSARDD